MSPRLLLLGLCGILGSPILAVTIPAGTEIQLRLTSEVSSDKASGSSFTAVVIGPVVVNNQEIIGLGTQVSGKTADARADQPTGNGGSESPATLRLQVTQIMDDSGRSHPISCALVGVDNARESVDQTGLITGITASHTFSAMADAGVNKLEEKGGLLGGLVSDAKSALVKPADPTIDYKAGVEFTVKLTGSLDWNSSGRKTMNLPQVTPLDVLTSIVNQVPFRTTALKPASPSDLTNLMFIGSKQQVEATLKAAGWFPSDPLGRASTFHTAQALIDDSGYDEAPMSVLTLDGKTPDMTFEKLNDTFASRHHIRIWQQGPTFAGRPVFVAAATHDIKIYFSRTSRSITHGIDPNIDRERAKVTNDFLFTQQIQAVSLIPRTNIPQHISNATGDVLQTDDKIAVLEFKP